MCAACDAVRQGFVQGFSWAVRTQKSREITNGVLLHKLVEGLLDGLGMGRSEYQLADAWVRRPSSSRPPTKVVKYVLFDVTGAHPYRAGQGLPLVNQHNVGLFREAVDSYRPHIGSFLETSPIWEWTRMFDEKTGIQTPGEAWTTGHARPSAHFSIVSIKSELHQGKAMDFFSDVDDYPDAEYGDDDWGDDDEEEASVSYTDWGHSVLGFSLQHKLCKFFEDHRLDTSSVLGRDFCDFARWVVGIVQKEEQSGFQTLCLRYPFILHIVVSAPDCSLETVRKVYQANPENIQREDSNGLLPLHAALVAPEKRRPLNWKILPFLIEKYPQALGMTVLNGRLPLHVALDRMSQSQRYGPIESFESFLPKEYEYTLFVDYVGATKHFRPSMWPWQCFPEAFSQSCGFTFYLAKRQAMYAAQGTVPLDQLKVWFKKWYSCLLTDLPYDEQMQSKIPYVCDTLLIRINIQGTSSAPLLHWVVQWRTATCTGRLLRACLAHWKQQYGAAWKMNLLLDGHGNTPLHHLRHTHAVFDNVALPFLEAFPDMLQHRNHEGLTPVQAVCLRKVPRQYGMRQDKALSVSLYYSMIRADPVGVAKFLAMPSQGVESARPTKRPKTK